LLIWENLQKINFKVPKNHFKNVMIKSDLKNRRHVMKIAVVGAGLSGAHIVRSLLDHPNFTLVDTIDIFEPREKLGPGLPYHATDDESIMLNVPPDIMSVDPSNPDDFIEWLNENYEEPRNFEGLVSRPKYGKYLLERFKPYFEHQQVQHIQAAVLDMKVIEVEKQTAFPYIYQIKTDKGWQAESYDAVFLSIGHPPYNNFYDLTGAKNYIHNPYPMKEKLADFKSDEKIGIVGSGATGIDLMRYFETNYDLKQPLTFYDVKEPFNFVDIPYEAGSVTFSFSMDWIEEEKAKHQGFIPLESMLDLFKKDMAAENVNVKKIYNTYKANDLKAIRSAFESNDQELAAIQEHCAKLVAYLPQLYNALSGEDKDTYLNHYHHKLLFFKTRVPNQTFKWLFELVDAGKLKGVSNLENIVAKDDGTFAILRDDGKKETADILINASGFDANLARVAEQSPLIKNLYDRKIIIPHMNGKFVLVDWPKLHVINQRYGAMANLFFTGLLVGGTQHENNDAGLTIQQGTYIAKAFMNHFST